jgi:hypothetical protein
MATTAYLDKASRVMEGTGSLSASKKVSLSKAWERTSWQQGFCLDRTCLAWVVGSTLKRTVRTVHESPLSAYTVWR